MTSHPIPSAGRLRHWWNAVLVIDERHVVTDEYVVLDVHPFANEGWLETLVLHPIVAFF